MDRRALPPINYAEGLKNSLEVRRQKSADHDKMIWDALCFFARYEGAQTLQQFVDELNAVGLKTAREKNWNTGTLSHLFKRHNVTAKMLKERMGDGSLYEKRKEIPLAFVKAMMEEIRGLDSLNPSNGKWVSGHKINAEKSDMIKHSELGEGQFLQEKPLGRFTCRFSDENGSFDTILPASEVEVFVFNLSRGERIRKSDLIQKRYENRYIK